MRGPAGHDRVAVPLVPLHCAEHRRRRMSAEAAAAAGAPLRKDAVSRGTSIAFTPVYGVYGAA